MVRSALRWRHAPWLPCEGIDTRVHVKLRPKSEEGMSLGFAIFANACQFIITFCLSSGMFANICDFIITLCLSSAIYANVCQFIITYGLSSAIFAKCLPIQHYILFVFCDFANVCQFIITYCLSSAIFANVCQFIIAKCRAVFLTQLSAEICKAISSTENSYIYLSVLGWRQWGWRSGHPVYQHRLTLRTTSVKVKNCPLLNSMAGRLAIQEHKWLKQG